MLQLFSPFVWYTCAAIVVQTQESFQTVIGPEFSFLNVDEVWKKGFTGKGIVVAVVDDGVNFKHEDLKQNYNKNLSYDFMENDNIPNPIKSHGTNCAGLIAARKNGTCRTGIAYNAQIAGIKTLNVSFSKDKVAAAGFSYKRNEIDIYSSSWGPTDNGYIVGGPGPLVKKALEEGANQGRNGRGSIFVFSSGNGGLASDSCAFDGYINNIHTIAIGAVFESGKIPLYAESCSSVMAVTYGGNLKTCDINGVTGCVPNFGRTSSAAAMASGIIALLLEANPKLSWRDVQHLIVRTSKPKREITGVKEWTVNGAGLMVHPSLGFGVMDANRLIDVAQKWKTVPKQKQCSIEFSKPRMFLQKTPSFTIDIKSVEKCSKIKAIEHVQVQLSLNFPTRALLEMHLVSPLGTRSKILYKRVYDALTRRKVYKDLIVTSLHFWGENPTAGNGEWLILFSSSLFKYSQTPGTLSKFIITFYGTRQDPISEESKLTKGLKSCRFGKRKKNFWKGYGSKCCGTVGLYDKNHGKCCRGTGNLVERTPQCGGDTYDQCTQICCDGAVHNKTEGVTLCCGKKAYDMRKQMCCGRIIPKIKCQRLRYRNGYHSRGKYLHEAQCARHPNFGEYPWYKRKGYKFC